MRVIDEDLTIELNFIDEMNLSKNGLIQEILSEFDIVRLCFKELSTADPQERKALERILVMPLRKLLCDKQSPLITLHSDFKMPPLEGYHSVLPHDGMHIVRIPYIIDSCQSDWISLSKWLEQRIAWYERNSSPKIIPEFTYNSIINRLNTKKYRKYQSTFSKMYTYEPALYRNCQENVYIQKNITKSAEMDLQHILNEIGYNQLTIYEMIKKLSDKRGAHIDSSVSIISDVINSPDKDGLTPIHYFALQMITAAKAQIPEIANTHTWVK